MKEEDGNLPASSVSFLYLDCRGAQAFYYSQRGTWLDGVSQKIGNEGRDGRMEVRLDGQLNRMMEGGMERRKEEWKCE